MLRIALCLTLLLAPAAHAGGVVAARTLPAGTVLSAADLTMGETPASAISDPSLAVGMQTRITIYEGRAIHANALRPPQLIERNQIVRLAFQRGALRIEAEGRALSPGAAGDVIRVMNTASRQTISVQVGPNGSLTPLN